MLGRDTHEIAIRDMNWETATKMVQLLVEQEYATMVTLEENLIIIDYVYAGDYHCTQANRNNVAFMGLDEYEDTFRDYGEGD